MPHYGQTVAKEYYYDWCKHINNQCGFNRLILEKSVKITTIRIMEWKTDEGWSYKWCHYYKTVGYQIFTDKKAGIIEIRNQNTSMVLILRLIPYCVKKQHILENLFRKFAD